MNDQFARLTEMYTSGSVPWDAPEPPPEVLAFAPTLPPGRALDLGCGPGRASIYLARLGWQVDGVDFVPQAIDLARQRAREAGVSGVTFHLGPVTALPQLNGPYDFALDVGCAHNFSVTELTAYQAELRRLIRPGGSYLLFAHLSEVEGDRWLWEPTLGQIFADGFRLGRVEYGQTTVRDETWRSAWFWFERVDHTSPIQLPAHDYLDRAGIPYERRTFPSTTEKGAANVAQSLGYEERQMIKTLIFESKQGERVLVMLGGDQNAISGHLKKAIGSRDIRLASPAAVKETTGYVIGSIPPFGWQPTGFRTLLEASLLNETVLGVGTGQWGEEILISPENLIRACRPLLVNLTDRSQPVLPTG